MDVQVRSRPRQRPAPDSGAAPDSSCPTGVVLALSGTEWAYGRGQDPGTPLTMIVTAVRDDLTACYRGEWTWVDGHTPACRADHPPCRQALVRTSVLRRGGVRGAKV